MRTSRASALSPSDRLIVPWRETLAEIDRNELASSVRCYVCGKPTGVSPVVLAANGATRAKHPECGRVVDP